MSFRVLRAIVFAAWLLMPLVAFAQGNSIQGSLHDLSVTGRGQVKSNTETRVCLFCHASHVNSPNAKRPMWTQQLSTVTSYNQYSSTTFRTPPNPPSNRSKLCLSCHDGTVGIGQTYAVSRKASGSIPVQGSIPVSRNLGTDLSGDHPFGFSMPVADDGEIKLSLTAPQPVTSDPAVKLYDNKIECVTCHDPHTPNLDSSVQFLVRSNTNGALCLACHDPARGTLSGWSSSQHALSANAVQAGAQLPYPSVAANACASCHAGHNTPGTSTRLLRGSQATTCGKCHGVEANVSPALANVISEFNKTYSHPVNLPASAPHEPGESLPINNSRHAECADCHNPHAAKATTVTSAPNLPPTMAGVSGISSSGGAVTRATNEYEVCFKCHADSNNKPQSPAYTLYGREAVRTTTASDPYNVRLDLTSPIARHNVVQPARPGISPSLRPTMLDLAGTPTGRSLQASAYIYCSDCHNSDGARDSGGTSPNGTHGSKWPHLLERSYAENVVPAQGAGGRLTGIPYTSGINGSYALCDKCHDLDGRLNLSGAGTDAVFGKHRSHVVSDGASCSVCHASHGVQSGTASGNAHLVNFDAQIVGPVGTNVKPYIDTSRRQCFLTCHGVPHSGYGY